MLQSFDLAGVARYIKDHKCHNIVVLCGAGMSTSAGIPDFRTPGSGLYDNLQRFNLTEPETIFDLRFFQREPGEALFMSFAENCGLAPINRPSLITLFACWKGRAFCGGATRRISTHWNDRQVSAQRRLWQLTEIWMKLTWLVPRKW
eukprot:symbB.v1.2.026833.t1/scaffold2715.1/size72513/5